MRNIQPPKVPNVHVHLRRRNETRAAPIQARAVIIATKQESQHPKEEPFDCQLEEHYISEFGEYKRASDRPRDGASLSSRGVVFLENGKVEQHMSIASWEREVRIFEMLKQINLFSKFFAWRTVLSWCREVKRSRLRSRGEFLSGMNICLDLHGGPNVVKIRTSIVAIINSGHRFLLKDLLLKTVDEFRNLEIQHITNAIEGLQSRFLQINAIVDSTCKRLDQACILREEGADFNERSVARKKAVLFRLAKYMIDDARKMLLCSGVNELASWLATCQGVFKGNVKISTAQVDFSPTLEECTTAFDQVVSAISNNSPIGDHSSFVSATHEINMMTASVFEKCHAHSQQLAHWCGVLAESECITPHEITSTNRGLEWIRKTLSSLRGALSKLEAGLVPLETVVGFFIIDNSSVYRTVGPSAESAISTIEDFVPIQFERKLHVLAVKMGKASSRINDIPTALDEVESFISFCQFFDLEHFETEFSSIVEYSDFIESENLTISPSVRTLFENVCTQMVSLREQCDEIESTKERVVDYFSNSIGVQLSDISTAAKELFAELSASILREPCSDCTLQIAVSRECERKSISLLTNERRLLRFQNAFGIEALANESLHKLKNVSSQVTKLWTTIEEWNLFENNLLQLSWRQWKDLNTSSISSSIASTLTECADVDSPALVDLRQRWNEILSLQFILDAGTSSTFLQHHWKRLDEVVREHCGVSLLERKEINLEDLRMRGVENARSDVSKLLLGAAQEVDLEKRLSAIQAFWNGPNQSLKMILYRTSDQRDMWLVDNGAELLDHLEESATGTQVLLNNRFCTGPVQAKAERFLVTVRTTRDTIKAWLEFQGRWSLIEAILKLPEVIRRWAELGDDRFSRADKFFRDVVRQHSSGCKVVQHFGSGVLLASFLAPLQMLQELQQSVASHLDARRERYPRLYFVDDRDLLEILSSVKNPERISYHIHKLHGSIGAIEIVDSDITGVIGRECGERIALTAFRPRGDVESWLLQLESGVHLALQRETACLQAECKSRSTIPLEVIERNSLQALCIGSHLTWSDTVSSWTLRTGKETISAMVDQCTVFASYLDANIDSILRLKLSGFVAHFATLRDAMDRITKRSGDVSQEILYSAKGGDDSVAIEIGGSFLKYGWEYSGMHALCIASTPRHYHMLCHAVLSLNLFCAMAVAGPSSSGRTEFVRDFSRVVGRHCVVMRCSQDTSLESLFRTIRGGVLTNSVSCLGNVDLLLPITRSQVGAVINEILHACRKRLRFVNINGVATSIAGVTQAAFVGTVQNSPPSVSEIQRMQFRPTSLVIPDYYFAIDRLLAAAQFHHSSDIALSLSRLRDMLQNSHLAVPMNLIQIKQIVKGLSSRPRIEKSDEHRYVAQAVFQQALPRINTTELALVAQMINCTVGKHCGSVELTRVTATAETEPQFQYFKQLQAVENFLDRLDANQIVAIIGEIGSGKTTVRRMAMRCLKVEVANHSIFPNTMSSRDLFGVFDSTGGWREGCLHHQLQLLISSEIMDSLASANKPQQNWITLDGLGDGVWLDFFLQSALDLQTHGTISFGSGEKQTIPSSIKFVLECPTLQSISPAASHRLSIVVVEFPCSDEELVRNVVSDEVEALPLELKSAIPTRDVVELVLKFMKRFIFPSEASPTSFSNVGNSSLTPSHVTQAFGKILRATVKSAVIDYAEGATFLHCLAFALTWSTGCILHHSELEAFDIFCRSAFDYTTATYPSSGLVFDYYLFGGRWVKWCDLPTMTPGNRACTAGGNVEFTSNVRKLVYLQKLLASPQKNSSNLLVHSKPGTGRSAMLQGLVHALGASMEASNFPVLAQFHHSTRPVDVFTHADTSSSNAAGDVAGSGKNVALLVDDVFLPSDTATIDSVRALLEADDIWDASRRRRRHTSVQSCVASTSTSSRWNATNDRLASKFLPIVLHLGEQDEGVHPFQQLIDEWRHFSEALPRSLRAVSERVVHATIEVFHGCLTTLTHAAPNLETHQFSLYHLRDAFLGMLRGVRSPAVHDASALCSLWTAECYRAFGDRFGGIVGNPMQQQFVRTLEEVGRRNQFGMFMTDAMWSSWSGTYEPISYNSTTKRSLSQFCPKGSLITEYLLRYATKVSRVISTPGSHGLLLGESTGLGQRFTAAVACNRSGCRLVTCESDAESPLIEALREAVSRALEVNENGVPTTSPQQRQSVILVPNVHLMGRGVQGLLHRILAGQDWSSFFTTGDKEAMRSQMRATKQLIGARTATVDNEVWSLVQQRVTVLMTASTSDGKYQETISQFPTLITNCTNITFTPWPTEALEALAIRGIHPVGGDEDLAGSRMGVDGPEGVFAKENVARALQVHACMASLNLSRHAALVVSTTAFMDYVHVFRRLHDAEKVSLDTSMLQLREGRTALTRTQGEVEKLRAKIQTIEPELASKSDSMSSLLKVMNERKEVVVGIKDSMAGRQQVAQRDEHSARAVRAEAENELLAALPEFNSALDAVRELQKSDVDEIRRYNVPTRGTSLTLEAVLTLLDEKNAGDWSAAKAVMGNGKFLERMVNLNVRTLSQHVVDRINQLAKDPEFTPERIKSTASEACSSICRWVIAVRQYHAVYITSVAPRQQQLAEAEQNAASAMAKLKDSKAQLLDAHHSVTSLETTLATTEKDHSSLQMQLNTCRRRLKRAEELSERLGDEASRWDQQHKDLTRRGDVLALQVHLFAALMCYGSALDAECRSDVLTELRRLPSFAELKQRPCTPSEFLLSQPTALRWQAGGLPQDAFLQESAHFTIRGISCSKRWPLLIDPDGVGRSWLSHLPTFRDATHTNGADEAAVIQTLRHNVRQGTATIVNGINYHHIFSERTLVVLHDVLHRNLQTVTTTVGTGEAAEIIEETMVRIGDELIPYNASFSLALICSQPLVPPAQQHPDDPRDHRIIPPGVAASVRVINFTASRTARIDVLLGQLLAVALGSMESERRAALTTIADLKERVIASQAGILSLLSTAAARSRTKDAERVADEDMNSLLDNESLTTQLLEVKTVVQTAERAAYDVRRNDVVMNEQRETLRAIAEAALACISAIHHSCCCTTVAVGVVQPTPVVVSKEQLQKCTIRAVQRFILDSDIDDDTIVECMREVIKEVRDTTRFACDEALLPTLDAALVTALLRESTSMCNYLGCNFDIEGDPRHELWVECFSTPSTMSTTPMRVRLLDDMWNTSITQVLEDAGGALDSDVYPRIDDLPDCGLEKQSARWALMAIVVRPDLLCDAIPHLVVAMFGHDQSPSSFALRHLSLEASAVMPLALLTGSSHSALWFLEALQGSSKRPPRAIRPDSVTKDSLMSLLEIEQSENDILWRSTRWILLEDAHLAAPDVLECFFEKSAANKVSKSSSRLVFALSCPTTPCVITSLPYVERCVRLVVDRRSEPPLALEELESASVEMRALLAIHVALSERHNAAAQRHSVSGVDYNLSHTDVKWAHQHLSDLMAAERTRRATRSEGGAGASVEGLPPYRLLHQVAGVVYGTKMTSTEHYHHLTSMCDIAQQWCERNSTEEGTADDSSGARRQAFDHLTAELRAVGRPPQIQYAIARSVSAHLWASCAPAGPAPVHPLAALTLPPGISAEECAHPRIQQTWDSSSADAITAWLREEVRQYNRLLQKLRDFELDQHHGAPTELRSWLPASYWPRFMHTCPHDQTTPLLLRFIAGSHKMLLSWLRKGQTPSPISINFVFSPAALLDAMYCQGAASSARSATIDTPQRGQLRLSVGADTNYDSDVSGNYTQEEDEGLALATPPRRTGGAQLSSTGTTWVISGLRFASDCCMWAPQTRQLLLTTRAATPSLLPNVIVRFVPESAVDVCPPPPRSPNAISRVLCPMFPEVDTHNVYHLPLMASKYDGNSQAIPWDHLNVNITASPDEA